MSSLPSSYPRLSLHLTDRAHTPFISSPLSLAPQQQLRSSRPQQQQQVRNHAAARQSQLQALHNLTNTALTAHDMAARFGLGLPTRIMVEYGSRGGSGSSASASSPVVLTSYIRAKRKVEEGRLVKDTQLLPAVSTDSIPIDREEGPQQPLSSSPFKATHNSRQPSPSRGHEATSTTAAPTPALPNLTSPTPPTAPEHPDNNANTLFSPASTPAASSILGEDSFSGPSAPRPMLLSLVVSPTPDDLADARRAASRLERVGRELQHVLQEELNRDSDSLAAPGVPGTEVGGDSPSAPATLAYTSAGNTTAGEEDENSETIESDDEVVYQEGISEGDDEFDDDDYDDDDNYSGRYS